MALAAIVDSLDSLSEEIKKEYVKKDGRFHLDVTPVSGFAMENIEGLKTTLGRLKTEKEQAEEKVNAFDGLDIAAARKALATVKALGDNPEGDVKAQIESAVTQVKSQYDEQILGIDTNLKSVTSALEAALIDNAAVLEISGLKGSPELLLPHVKAQCIVKKDGDNYKVLVKGSDGNPRINIVDGQTVDFTIKDLVGEMSKSDAFAPAFGSQAKSGPGGPSDTGVKTPKGEVRVIGLDDQSSIDHSLEDIASGKATIDMS